MKRNYVGINKCKLESFEYSEYYEPAIVSRFLVYDVGVLRRLLP